MLNSSGEEQTTVVEEVLEGGVRPNLRWTWDIGDGKFCHLFQNLKFL
jgi:hypothetical protein